MAWCRASLITGWLAAQGEDPEPREEVEVPVAVVVDQIGALGPDVLPVEPQGLQHLDQLRVHELRMQVEALALVLCHQGGKVERHVHSPVGSAGCRQNSGRAWHHRNPGRRPVDRQLHRPSRAVILPLPNDRSYVGGSPAERLLVESGRPAVGTPGPPRREGRRPRRRRPSS